MIPLDHIVPSDVDRVGGKASHCARLKQAGLPVPDGVAVTIDAMVNVDALAAQLTPVLAGFPDTARFAVRSSAVDEDGTDHSFAGIHETKLNVTHAGILDAIRACWDSVQSPTALAYRRTQHLPAEDIHTGVLIQLMIQPVVSGVAFTLNPITGRDDELVISSAWGLGEALVSGQVEPDEYRVHKGDGTVLSTHIGTKHRRVVADNGVSHLIDNDMAARDKPTLSPEQLRELAQLLIRIERDYGTPQDVEWCHDGEQFWIVQTRLVTAVATLAGPDPEWTRANLREVLPDLPSPQMLDIVCDLLDRSTRLFYGSMIAPPEELGPMAKAFYGRPYFNFSQLRRLSHYAGLPLATTMRGWGHAEAVRDQDEVAAPRTLRELLRTAPAMVRVISCILTTRRRVHRQMARVEASLTHLAAYEPETLSDTDLLEVAKVEGLAVDTSVDVALLLAAGIGNIHMALTSLGRRAGVSVEPWLQIHLASGEKTVSAQQGFDFLTLANVARDEPPTQSYFLNAPDSFTR